MGFLGRPTEQEEQRAEQWQRWIQRQHPLAIGSLVLGVFSLIEFGVLLIFGIAGIVLGLMALSQLRQMASHAGSPLPRPDEPDANSNDHAQLPPHRDRGHGLAWTGIVTSVLSLIIAAFVYLR